MEIRQCQESDLPALFDVFKDVFRGNPRLIEKKYFDWLFLYSPYNQDGYNFWLAWESNLICGFAGGIPLEFCHQGKKVMACEVINLQGNLIKNKNVGLELLGIYTKQFDYRFYRAISDDARKIYQLMKIPILDELARYVLGLNVDLMGKLFKADEIKKLHLSQWIPDQDEGNFIFIKKFEKDFEHCFVWDSITSHLIYSEKYLNWRYVDIPSHEYHIIQGDTEEYVVYRCEQIKDQRDCWVIRILEFNVKPVHGKQALNKIFNHLKEKGNLVLMDFFTSTVEIGKALTELGFVDTTKLEGKPIPHLFRPIHYSDGYALALDIPPHFKKREFDFGSCYTTKGDSDLDRVKL